MRGRKEVRKDGELHGWTDRRSNAPTVGRLRGRITERGTDGRRTECRTDGRSHGRTETWTDKRKGGSTDGREATDWHGRSSDSHSTQALLSPHQYFVWIITSTSYKLFENGTKPSGTWQLWGPWNLARQHHKPPITQVHNRFDCHVPLQQLYTNCMLDKRALTNPPECTSLSVKPTSRARVMNNSCHWKMMGEADLLCLLGRVVGWGHPPRTKTLFIWTTPSFCQGTTGGDDPSVRPSALTSRRPSVFASVGPWGRARGPGRQPQA